MMKMKLKKAEFMPADLNSEKAWCYYCMTDPIDIYKSSENGTVTFYWWHSCGDPEKIGGLDDVTIELEDLYDSMVDGSFQYMIGSGDKYEVAVARRDEVSYTIIATIRNRRDLDRFQDDCEALEIEILTGRLEVDESIGYSELKDILE